MDWVAAIAHPPKRPEWICEACDADWPCAPAREELRTKYDVVDLAIYMLDLTPVAARECPMLPQELADRFLMWTA